MLPKRLICRDSHFHCVFLHEFSRLFHYSVKSLGGEITKDSIKKKKHESKEHEVEPDEDEELPSREFDGVAVSGLTKVKKVKQKTENFEQSEDWVLQRLFKKAGAVIETAVDQRSVKEGGNLPWENIKRTNHFRARGL